MIVIGIHVSLIYTVITFGFDPSDYSIDESGGSQTVSVVRTGAIDGALTFNITAGTEANPNATATGIISDSLENHG